MSGSLASAANAEPNLTPMLDMVFQLVTFFMLVINFKANAMDLDMSLPIVGSAAPVETKGEETMIVNINKSKEVTMFGQKIANIPSRMAEEGTAARLKYGLKKGDKLPATVVIRADAGTRFELLNKVITAAQFEGFRHFSLKAMNKADDRPAGKKK